MLLLAVADDAIGMAIIAIFYPDPLHAVEPQVIFQGAFGIVKTTCTFRMLRSSQIAFLSSLFFVALCSMIAIWDLISRVQHPHDFGCPLPSDLPWQHPPRLG